MQERKMYITERSVDLINELRKYVWDTNRQGEKLAKPIDKYNHGIDAMRYIYTDTYDNKHSGEYHITKL